MNTTLQISWASLQAFLVAVAVERDFSKWRLGWNVGLAAIIYSVRRRSSLSGSACLHRRHTVVQIEKLAHK